MRTDVEGNGPPVVLAVGGWDPTCGAGLAADLLSIAMNGARARAAVSVITAQGGGKAVVTQPVDPFMLEQQMQRAIQGLSLAAIKTGALGSEAQVRCVASLVGKHPHASLVVDPVMGATAGGELTDVAGVRALCETLFPLTTLVTPNLNEAALLASMDGGCSAPADMERAADAILSMGPRWVLIKGGHLVEQPADLLAGTDGKRTWLGGSRIAVHGTHGTGCVLASALAAHLALGASVPEACGRARHFLRRALVASSGPDPAPDLAALLGSLDLDDDGT